MWTAPQIDDRTVAILHAGPLGRRVALSWILNGFDIRIYDLDISSRNTTAAFIAHNTRKLYSHGQLHVSTDFPTVVSQAWLTIEAAEEEHDVQNSLFVEAAGICPEDAILATTSPLGFAPGFLDANAGEYGKRTVGIRYVTSTAGGLVELLKTPLTSLELVEFLCDRIDECDLTCVVEATGSFRSIIDRMRAAIETERLKILSEGVTNADKIDVLCQSLVGSRETSSTQTSASIRAAAARAQNRIEPRQTKRKPQTPAKSTTRNLTSSSWLLTSAKPQMSPLIYVLDLGTAVEHPSLHTGRVCLGSAEINEMQTLVEDQPRPDGIDICLNTGRMYWTCMGVPGKFDGLIRSCELQGGTPIDLIPKGRLNTPKQIAVDHINSKLYFCDREGMKVWRCGLDGQDLETIIDAGDPGDPDHRSDPTRWCVGICLGVTNA